jgi:Arylsulfotransferase (ASST)
VSIAAPAGTLVSVAGQPWGAGAFSVTVTRAEGQSFAIVVLPPSQPPSTYYVRCLLADFPSWSVQRSGSTQAEYYVTSTFRSLTHPVIFDSNGVPLWWAPPASTQLATLLPDGNMAWLGNGGAEERRLDGSLVQTIKPTVGSADGHDLLLLANGDYVMITSTLRSGVDLSGLCVGTVCGPSNATVTDPVVQELKPDGTTLVWSWDAADHIPATEMNSQWYQQYIVDTGCGASNSPCDVYHWNSVEPTSTGFLLSFRHMDAIYNIDQTTRNIVWRIGGAARRVTSPDGATNSNTSITAADGAFSAADIGSTITDSLGNIPVGTTITAVASPTAATISQAATGTTTVDVFTPNAESLTVNGDSVFTGGSHFGGQHDARVLSDGTVTLYDDGTNLGRAPRAVRYQLDTTAHTATLVEQASDPLIANSSCCGSARKLLAGGDWVMGWGGTNTASEMTADGTRVFLLTFAGAVIVYRATPVPFGVLDRAALRAGMDAQYSSSGAAHTATQSQSGTAPPRLP